MVLVENVLWLFAENIFGENVFGSSNWPPTGSHLETNWKPSRSHWKSLRNARENLNS